jgi:mRNA-degrading endonuclease RelE of RelBE toxin-antitoxin system
MKSLFSNYFKSQLKRLKKKYPNVVVDLLEELDDFDVQTCVPIGRSIYKLRIGSTDMKKGKSGGFRSYVYLFLKGELLVPLCIYPKSETESITSNELQVHFENTIIELPTLNRYFKGN